MTQQLERSLFELGAVALGAYLAWRYLRERAAALVNPVLEPIAGAWVWATAGAPVQATGNVVLPDGRLVPWSSVGGTTFDAKANVLRFTYGGRAYYVAPNPTGGPAYDTDGNYHALEIAT